MNKTIRRIKQVIRCTLAFASLWAYSAPAFAASDHNYTQNWAESAVFYTSPCDETEAFLMTDEEFLFHRINLENRLVCAYSVYLSSLEGDRKDALKSAQKAWLDCYYAYVAALEQLWLEPVKIHFAVTGHERRTNVYRELVLLLLTNRITDLEEWNMGRMVSMDEGLLEQKTEELNEMRRQLQIDMGLCNYVIQEEYRLKIMDSHKKFFIFFDKNQEFVSLLTDDPSVITGECLLQLDRMTYMTGVHYEGCRFFRREREE